MESQQRGTYIFSSTIGFFAGPKTLKKRNTIIIALG
jgi:hypothetical protein